MVVIEFAVQLAVEGCVAVIVTVPGVLIIRLLPDIEATVGELEVKLKSPALFDVGKGIVKFAPP